MLLDKQEEVRDSHQRTLLLVPSDPVLAIGIQVLEGLQEEKELVFCVLGVGCDWVRPAQDAIGSVHPNSVNEMAPFGGDRGLLLFGWAAGCED